MSDEVTPDLQPTTTKRRSRNKLWLFFGVAPILIIGIIDATITHKTLQKIEKVQNTKCKDNLKRISLALMQYTMDYGGHFPINDGIKGLEKLQQCEYMTGSFFRDCLSGNIQIVQGKLNDKDISYVYFGGFKELSSECWPRDKYIPILFDRPENHKNHINYIDAYGVLETLTTKAKNCSEFIEELNKQFKYPPELLKKLREKAAEADRRYSQEK